MKKMMLLILLMNLFSLHAQNPFLPYTAFVPDGEPHVFEYKGEKRLFIYGSRDERVTAFCGYGHDVWSAPIGNLSKWTNHGEIFNIKQVQEIGYGRVKNQHFGAPDCVYNPVTKKYYLYTFLGATYHLNGVEGPSADLSSTIHGFGDYGPKCVRSESTSPVGPFINPIMCDWPALNKDGTFDPSVLVWEQKDGSVRAFAFWGMRTAGCWAELDPNDMHTIINGKTRKPDIKSWFKTLNNPTLNNYQTIFEASSIKQVAEDKFVFICSANERVSALTYFFSNSPEGPWKYGGRIVDNGKTLNGGNNHGGIVKVNDKWYVTYHKKTTNSFNRQTMIEPINMSIRNDSVIIPEVETTSQGIISNGLNAFDYYYAGTVCDISKNVFVDGAQRNPDGMNPVVVSGPISTLGWKYFNFGDISLNKEKELKLVMNLKTYTKDLVVDVMLVSKDKKYKYEIKGIKELKYVKADDKYHKVILPLYAMKTNGNLSKFKYALYLNIHSTKTGKICDLLNIGFLNN